MDDHRQLQFCSKRQLPFKTDPLLWPGRKFIKIIQTHFPQRHNALFLCQFFKTCFSGIVIARSQIRMESGGGIDPRTAQRQSAFTAVKAIPDNHQPFQHLQCPVQCGFPILIKRGHLQVAVCIHSFHG